MARTEVGRGEAENCNVGWPAARDWQFSPHQYSGHITAESLREQKREDERKTKTERKNGGGGGYYCKFVILKYTSIIYINFNFK